MSGKKCPYCGRRIPYTTVFHEKKHGLYKCGRCKKESKIKTDFKLLIAFIAVVLIVVLYIILWQTSKFHNQFIGVFPPIIILIAFYACTPLFISFAPLRKYVENQTKTASESSVLEEVSSPEDFVFDRKIFDQIKNNRSTPANIEQKIDSMDDEDENMVHIIKDVSEAHASSDAPLRRVARPAPEAQKPQPYEEEEVKQYIPKKTKPDGSKYTANRKF